MSTHALLLLAAILVAPTATAASPEMARPPTDAGTEIERFDVSHGAVRPLPRSADGRFVVLGTLRRVPQALANGRFRLRASATAIDDRGTATDP
jgi:hypothetical protein